MESMQDQQRRKMKIAVVAWGGQGGVSWDDGTYRGIREITLTYGRCIDSISLVYDKNGKAIKSEKHGGTGGTKTAQIKLNYPEEYIVSVTGYYSPVIRGATPVIRSLTFKTNKRTFGPYGPEEGIPFAFSLDGGKIIGFKGRSGWYIDAIGFHIARIQSTNLTKRLQQWLQRCLDPKNSKESLNGKNAKVYAWRYRDSCC